MSAEVVPSGGNHSSLAALSVAAMGVVFGDIGTSPLYTMKEVFSSGHHPVPVTPDNVLGILSLVFWAMTITVSLQYVMFITPADNKGAEGIMALTSLALRLEQLHPRMLWLLSALGIFGAALFYGDAAITPALSVLSAVEGLEVATPAFKPYVVPIAIGILIGLFLFQRKGTASVAALFGPVMLFWFATLAALGLWNILKHPSVLAAINPWYALHFFETNHLLAFLALGAVVLAITGGEALYADMGHFGRRPIKLAWLWFIFPALYVNYFGQGALILDAPETVQNPFFMSVPEALIYPLVGPATVATIIASQAVISGAFSLTSQAIQARLCAAHPDQIHLGRGEGPNLHSQHQLAAADRRPFAAPDVPQFFQPGVGLRHRGDADDDDRYPAGVRGGAGIVGMVMEHGHPFPGIFSSSSILPSFRPMSSRCSMAAGFRWCWGGAIFSLLATWKHGRGLLYARLKKDSMPLDGFIASLGYGSPLRVAGTSIFMTTNPDGVPRAMLHNLLHNKVLHEKVVLLNVRVEDVPYVDEAERVAVKQLPEGFFQVIVRYGFKDEPNIPAALEKCAPFGLRYESMETSFFLGRETTMPCVGVDCMQRWRQLLFTFMFRNAEPATAYFKIPTNRVVELGTQVEL